MTFADSIILGVISGIITSVFIYLIVLLFRKIILPWYHTLVYQGADISGDWQVMNIGNVQNAFYSFSQKANTISGTAIYVDKRDDSPNDKVRIFKIKGEIRDRFVSFSIQHSEKSRLGASVFLLQIVKDGTVLEGAKSSYVISNSTISSDNVTLTRREMSQTKKQPPNQALKLTK